MALMMSNIPTWKDRNLRKHYLARLQRDPGCFEDLLGIQNRQMTQAEYQQRSRDTVIHAWGKYRCESWDLQRREYRERRTYFVDNDLVVVIADVEERHIITCYHEHFDLEHKTPSGTIGQRILRYKERIAHEQKSEMIRNVEKVYGF